MPVLVSSVLESSSLGLIGHILSYKPRSIHTPHPRRIASMAESALDGSALGRVRGVTPLFLSQQLILGTLQKVNRGFCPVKTPNKNYVPPRASKHAPRGTESSLDFHAEQNLNQSSSATSIHQKGRSTWNGLCSQLFTDSYSKFIPTHPQKSSESYFSFGNRENSLP